MQIYHKFIYFIKICIFAFLVACSSHQKNDIMSVLETVDSLVMTQPDSARNLLLTVDESSLRNFNQAGTVFFNLLKTEADWKCYYPVAGDTAIFRTVDYYRKHGPEIYLLRALMMQGAVYEEMLEPAKALESYKEAVPFAYSCGDVEQLGILYSRIGELYQVSILNGQEAVNYYNKSLDCFRAINADERIMHTLLALSRAYMMVDSLDKAERYLNEGLEMADRFDDRLCLLAGMEQASHLYVLKEDYQSVIDVANHAVSVLGDTPLNNNEVDMYTALLANCVQGYIWKDKIDSAKFIASKLPLYTQYDSLVFYFLHADIASAEGDWKEAYECQAESDRISSAMLQASYDERLVEVEKKYETSRLQEELYRRNNRILVLVAVFAALAAAASVAFMLLGRAVKREKAEAERQTGIAVKLRDAAGRLEYALRAKSDEAAALKQEKHQEEEARRDLEGMLRQQAQSNMELLRYYGKAQKAMQDLVNIYDARSSNPRHFMEDALDVAKAFIVDMNSPAEAAMVIEAAYPGFLGEVFGEFPGLSDDDRHLIILTCCGYPNGAVCTILGISETNLAVRKTRLARRMGIGTSLVKYLRQRLGSWRHVE